MRCSSVACRPVQNPSEAWRPLLRSCWARLQAHHLTKHKQDDSGAQILQMALTACRPGLQPSMLTTGGMQAASRNRS